MTTEYENEKIVTEEYETETKCNMCLYRTTKMYRLEGEPDDRVVCGSCFTDWLVSEEAEVTIHE